MLGCIQPISSPMMKRMLGFWVCCAAAGTLGTIKAPSNVNTPSQVILIGILRLLVWLLRLHPTWAAQNCSRVAPPHTLHICAAAPPLSLGAAWCTKRQWRRSSTDVQRVWGCHARDVLRRGKQHSYERGLRMLEDNMRRVIMRTTL